MLKKIMKSFKHGEKGFTLIELLVVIAILGVLAAVAVPNVAGFMSRGNQAAVDTNRAAIQTAADAYAADTVANGGGGGNYTGVTAKLIPTYLRAPPTLGTYVIAANGTVTSDIAGTGNITGP